MEDNREIERLKAELAEAKEKLKQQEKLALVGQQVAHIIHDLGSSMHQIDLNYIAAIVYLESLENNLKEVGYWDEELYQELILDRKEEEIIPRITSALKNINNENYWMVDITDELIGFIGHDVENKIELIDLEKIVTDTIDKTYNSIKSKNIARTEAGLINYVFTLNCPKFVELKTDRIKLTRILLNLFDNAFFAIFAKKRSGNYESYIPQIKVALKPDTEGAIILIEDNGIGFPDKIKDKIFEPFITYKTGRYGTGLGLTIVSQLLTQIDGKLNIESIENQYTKVTLSIPEIKEND